MAPVLYLFFLNAFLDAIISDGFGITIIVERKWQSRNIQSRAETTNNHLSKARMKWDIFRFLDGEETIEGENRKMSKGNYPRIVQIDGQGIKSMDQLYQEPFCWQRGICHVDEESLISEYVLCGEYIKKDMKRCQKIDDKIIKRYATPSPKTRSSPGIINFAEGAPDGSTDQEEISEGDQRRLCQYRVSCYEKMGFHHLTEKQRQKSGRGGAVFSAKLAPPPGKKRTLKQVAKMAVQEVKKKEANIETKKRLDQSDGETILAQYLSERERKIQCKYRKSCYKTGKVPEIEGSALLNWLGRTKEQEKDEEREEKKENKRKMMEGMDDYQQKLYCRYRPSCYVSGTRAEATEREWNWSEIELDFGIQQKVGEYWSKLKKMVRRRKKPVESKDVEERSDGEAEKEDTWDDTDLNILLK